MSDLTKQMTGFQRLILTKVETGTLQRWLADARAMLQRLNDRSVEQAKLEDAVYEPFRNDNFSFSITDIKKELSTREHMPKNPDLDEKRKQEKEGRQLIRTNQFRHKR